MNKHLAHLSRLPTPPTALRSRSKRKSHSKSQAGCSACKRRRVKCDELIPCTNCQRRHDKCTLESVSQPVMKHCISCRNPESLLDWSREIYLMHHFTAVTSNSLNLVDEDVSQVWRSVVPELAHGSPFLTQGILALSALHLAYLKPSEEQRWIHLAFEYQNQAINAIQPIISNIENQDEENLLALFAAAVVLFMSSMADVNFNSLHPTQQSMAVVPIVSTILHIRGIHRVIEVGGDSIYSGSMASLFNLAQDHKAARAIASDEIATLSLVAQCRDTAISQISANDHTAIQFAKLRKLLSLELAGEVLDWVLSALLEVEIIYAEVNCQAQQQNGPWYPGIAWKWPTLISQGFIELLQSSHPAALVVLAHFAILSALFEEWYMCQWPEKVLESITAAVSSPWSQLLEWPIEQLENRLQQILGTTSTGLRLHTES